MKDQKLCGAENDRLGDDGLPCHNPESNEPHTCPYRNATARTFEEATSKCTCCGPCQSECHQRS